MIFEVGGQWRFELQPFSRDWVSKAEHMGVEKVAAQTGIRAAINIVADEWVAY